MADTQTQPEPTRNAGRPPLFESAEALSVLIEEYFAHCDPHTELRKVADGTNQKNETIWVMKEVMTEQRPYLMSGLARHLGIDRKSLLNYSKKDEFFPTLREAKARCEEFAEGQLYSSFSRGAQFSLKNNFEEWRDRTEHDHTTKDQPIPLLAGIAPATLEVEDEDEDDDGGSTPADDSTHQDS